MPGRPREGWDHSTGYLRRILRDVWGADLTVVEREFTLVGVNPALDDVQGPGRRHARRGPGLGARGRSGARRKCARDAYRTTLGRLRAVKERVDPGNVFFDNLELSTLVER